MVQKWVFIMINGVTLPECCDSSDCHIVKSRNDTLSCLSCAVVRNHLISVKTSQHCQHDLATYVSKDCTLWLTVEGNAVSV